MGYTHYWRIRGQLDASRFEAWTEDVKTLIAALPESVRWQRWDYASDLLADGTVPVTICGPLGSGKPHISPTQVSLNGDERIDADHETFIVNQDDSGFNCCKTEHKPYDLLVTAALIRLHRHFAAVKVSSDGPADAWEPGRALCEKVFGTAVVPFTDEDEEEAV